MFAAVKASVRRKTDQWLFQLREAEPGEVVLNQRRVFIVPTGAGFGCGALLVVLLIGSTNYTLSLGFALTFLVGCCALVDMVMTFRNLAHLRLAPGSAPAVFAGEEVRFGARLINRSKLDRFAIQVDFLHLPQTRHAIDVAHASDSSVVLACASTRRGYLAAPRVRLTTRFPLGLFRAWSYWQPDLTALIYPFPEPQAPPLPTSGVASEDGHGHAGQDDFAGVRSYQAGDSMRRLAWRQIARLDPALGGQLVTKHFEGGALDELVLDFDALPVTIDLELRLSRMTRWVLDAEARAMPYAFRIGATEFAPALGAAHQAACLRALALYDNAAVHRVAREQL